MRASFRFTASRRTIDAGDNFEPSHSRTHTLTHTEATLVHTQVYPRVALPLCHVSSGGERVQARARGRAAATRPPGTRPPALTGH